MARSSGTPDRRERLERGAGVCDLVPQVLHALDERVELGLVVRDAGLLELARPGAVAGLERGELAVEGLEPVEERERSLDRVVAGGVHRRLLPIRLWVLRCHTGHRPFSLSEVLRGSLSSSARRS